MEMENCSSRGEFKIFNRRAKKRINHPFKFVNSDGAKNVAKHTSEAFGGIFLMNGIWERRKEFRIKSPTTKFSLTKVIDRPQPGSGYKQCSNPGPNRTWALCSGFGFSQNIEHEPQSDNSRSAHTTHNHLGGLKRAWVRWMYSGPSRNSEMMSHDEVNLTMHSGRGDSKVTILKSSLKFRGQLEVFMAWVYLPKFTVEFRLTHTPQWSHWHGVWVLD